MSAQSNPITDLIAEKGVLMADGATGTNLFEMGLESGDAPELWNEDIGVSLSHSTELNGKK